MGGARHISLRGVRVHNLKSVDLDIPRGKLVVFCGLSGSGKTSLALDTLYAEGQRRYIESFSAYSRQFLDRLEKPDADRIDGLPPAIAVTGGGGTRSSRSTVGTVTEVLDYLRLLFAKIGKVICRQCGREVRRDSPQSVAAVLTKLPSGTRYMLAFAAKTTSGGLPADRIAAFREEGFVRAIVGESVVSLDEFSVHSTQCSVLSTQSANRAYVVVDRLAAGSVTEQRTRDSLETAFAKGNGTCFAFVEETGEEADNKTSSPEPRGELVTIDSGTWRRLAFTTRLACADCGIEYISPEPRLFSFNSPLGACPKCEGFGNITSVDMKLVVPDPSKSIRDGAIAPWNAPAYAHELEELMVLAPDYGLPVDAPYSELTAADRKLIQRGVRERKFGGLDGFFAWLQKRKYKMHISVFLSRWRRYRPCPACGGTRLRPEALDARIGGRNIAEISATQVGAAVEFFRQLTLSEYDRHVGHTMLGQVQSRLVYLDSVGLGYLTLDRTLRALSGGETRRVALTSAARFKPDEHALCS